jgi:murein DD-endopeptidase MepM/ murein hydrolase activator NlpD
MKAPTWSTVAIGTACGVLTGAIGAAVLMQLPHETVPLPSDRIPVRASPVASTEVMKPPTPISSTPRIGLEPIADLKKRHLEVPVRGIEPNALTDSFDQSREAGPHEAIDILAPRNTPIVAVEDGTIAKLFQSRAGGTTIYQFDSTSTYAYYYAHLERYADHLREGLQVRRGDVLGYDKKWWQGTAIDPFAVLR